VPLKSTFAGLKRHWAMVPSSAEGRRQYRPGRSGALDHPAGPPPHHQARLHFRRFVLYHRDRRHRSRRLSHAS
jgi:hypothetical protein